MAPNTLSIAQVAACCQTDEVTVIRWVIEGLPAVPGADGHFLFLAGDLLEFCRATGKPIPKIDRGAEAGGEEARADVRRAVHAELSLQEPVDHSARINELIRRLAKEPQLHDLVFRTAIFLGSSGLESSLVLPGAAAFAQGHVLIHGRQTPGLLLGNPAADHDWKRVGRHSDSTWVNVVLDSATMDEAVAIRFLRTANPAFFRELKAIRHPPPKWWDGVIEPFGRIFAINAGCGSGGVTAYRSTSGLYLDYSGLSWEELHADSGDADDDDE